MTSNQRCVLLLSTSAMIACVTPPTTEDVEEMQTDDQLSVTTAHGASAELLGSDLPPLSESVRNQLPGSPRINSFPGNCWGSSPPESETFIGSTPWFGGFGGGPSSFSTSATQGPGCNFRVLYALRVFVNSNSQVIRLQFFYYSPRNGTLQFTREDTFNHIPGDPLGTTSTGGFASDIFEAGTQQCAGGSIIVGLHGFADGIVNGVGISCKSLQDGTVVHMGTLGGTAGNFFAFGCDLQNAAISTFSPFSGAAGSRTGALVDGFNVACSRLTPNQVFWLQ